jgi:Sulfotransferase family
VTLPNFLILGAQKAGTTSLFNYLGQHPEVYPSPIKETHFFDHGGVRQTYAGPVRMPGPKIKSLDEYEGLFDGVRDEKAVGEATPTYLYLPGVAERIRHHVPEARLIAILRDPAERAYSGYQHAVRSGREPLRSFAAALAEEDRRVREGWHPIYHYRSRGFYHAQLSRYFALFGHEQVSVYLYDDLSSDPFGMLRGIFRFLGVSDSFTPDTSTRLNVSGVPTNRAVAGLWKRLGGLPPAVKRVVPFETRQRTKGRIFVKAPPLEPAVRRELVEAYREDVLRLEDLIGRDLSAWLRAEPSPGGRVGEGA